jgi:hypothetical protein
MRSCNRERGAIIGGAQEGVDQHVAVRAPTRAEHDRSRVCDGRRRITWNVVVVGWPHGDQAEIESYGARITSASCHGSSTFPSGPHAVKNVRTRALGTAVVATYDLTQISEGPRRKCPSPVRCPMQR